MLLPTSVPSFVASNGSVYVVMDAFLEACRNAHFPKDLGQVIEREEGELLSPLCTRLSQFAFEKSVGPGMSIE